MLSARLKQIYEMAASGRRVPAMEGIRGLAVLLVFFVHFDQLIAARLPHASLSAQVLQWLGWMGHSGVDLFFLLSGYLIYGVVRSGKKTVWGFLGRRMQRIYPTFLCVLLGYVIASLIAPAYSKIPHGAGPAALYLMANALLLPGLFAIVPMITVAWSLSYEVFYYAALPLIYWTVRMRRWNRPARIWFFLALAAAYCVYSAQFWYTEIPSLALKPAQHVRLIMFVAGILVYEATSVLELHSRIGRGFEFAVAALAAAAVLVLPAWPTSVPAAVPALTLFVAFGALCACCLCKPQGALATAFSFQPLRWLGNMSYSYYLIHGTIVHLARYLAEPFVRFSAPVVWLLLPVSFAMTWIGATVLFVCVEKPLSFPSHSAVRRPSEEESRQAIAGKLNSIAERS